MKITETIQINAENSKIWETLKSFKDPEKYIPIVQSSVVNGNGQGGNKNMSNPNER